MSIKLLEREIERLRIAAHEDERQADRFQTQANYNEPTQPAVEIVSSQAADKYNQEAEDFRNQIQDYQQQIETLNQKILDLQRERDELRRQADEIDREIIRTIG